MISIIVCSINQEYFDQFSKSVNETIGVEYEIVRIDNNIEKVGICEAYNKGVFTSKNPYLCFVHEDVIFKTKDWGLNLIRHFNNLENVGVLGVAGCSYKSLAPSGWWGHSKNLEYYNILQSYKSSSLSTKLTTHNNKSVERVLHLDGVFMAINKEVAQKIKFDSSIKGFHGYDMDFCLSVSEFYQNYFVPDILIQHLSEGKIDNTWIISAFLLTKKWRKKLPKSLNKIREYEISIEFFSADNYLSKLANSTISIFTKLKIWLYLFSFSIIRLRISKKLFHVFFANLYHIFKIFLYRKIN